jgi:hypothetical protein
VGKYLSLVRVRPRSGHSGFGLEPIELCACLFELSIELRARRVELPTPSRTIEALELREALVGSPWRIGRCQRGSGEEARTHGRGAWRRWRQPVLSVQDCHAMRHPGIPGAGEVHHVRQPAVEMADAPHVAR